MLWRFLAQRRRPVTAALAPLAALLAFGAGERAPGAFGAVASAAAAAVEPLQASVASAASLLSGAGDALLGGRLRRENEALRRENELLRREVQEGRERVAAAARLERLLGLRERQGQRSIAAGVIGHDASGLYRTILIDRGSGDGVRVNQGVLAPEGAVGRVVKVHAGSALVLLVTDRSSAIDALVQRTRDQGIAQGTGGGCALTYLARQAEVEVGDAVVTSGMGESFPKGVRIGEVSRVEKGSEMFQSVEVRPAAALERLEEVLVLAGDGEAR